jgi:hypothetical protein
LLHQDSIVPQLVPQLETPIGRTGNQSSLKRSDFNQLREIIYRETSIALDDSKQTLLQSRLQKRLKALGIPTYSQYLKHLLTNDLQRVELQKMINRVTTGSNWSCNYDVVTANEYRVAEPCLLQCISPVLTMFMQRLH